MVQSLLHDCDRGHKLAGICLETDETVKSGSRGLFNTGYSVLYGVIRNTNVSCTDVDDPNSPECTSDFIISCYLLLPSIPVDPLIVSDFILVSAPRSDIFGYGYYKAIHKRDHHGLAMTIQGCVILQIINCQKKQFHPRRSIHCDIVVTKTKRLCF